MAAITVSRGYYSVARGQVSLSVDPRHKIYHQQLVTLLTPSPPSSPKSKK